MRSLGPLGLLGAALLAALPLVALAVRARRDAVSILTVYLVLLMLIPAQWIVGPIGAAGTPAALVGLCAAWWWLAARLNPQWGLDVGPQPARVAILGHGWYMILTYGLMWLRPLTELEVNGAHRSLIALVALSGVALMTADGITTRERLDTLLRRLVVLGAIVAAIGAVQFVTGFDPVGLIRIPGLRMNQQILGVGGRSIFNRPFSTTLHPIELGVVLAMILPLALHFGFLARTREEKRRWWACVGLIAMGIPMSVSRSGILGVMVALPVLALAWSWRRRLNFAAGTVAFTAFTWAVIPGLVGTLRGLFTGIEDDPSIQARTERVPRMLELLAERPWFGRGVGTYSIEDYFLLDNQYYVSAIEVGILGVVVILALLFTGIAMGRAVYRRAWDPVDRHLAMALASAVVVVVVSIFTFDAFFYQIFSGLMFVTIGCLGALWRLAAAPEPARAVTVPSEERRASRSTRARTP